MKTTLLRAMLACVLLAVCACSDDAVRPADPGPATTQAFHPLTVGTAWTYRATRLLRFVKPNGGDARPPVDQAATALRAIVARETIAGEEWAVEEERFVVDGSVDTVVSWRRYREDPGGLYRADLSTQIPPGAAAADSLSAARRFAYPRTVGNTWLLREGDPDDTGTLESLDTLVTAIGTLPAYRVSYALEDDGPEDYRRFWYSARGILRSEVHTEFTAFDVATGDLIRIESTETFAIEEVKDYGRPRAHRPKTTRRGRETGARPAPVRR